MVAPKRSRGALITGRPLLWRGPAGRSTMQRPQFVCESPDMTDPLSGVIALLQPRAVFSRRISGAGRWGVRYSAFGQPSFCAVLEGSCRLTVDGHRPLTLEAGDFVLLPATPGFTMSGFEPVRFERFDPHVRARVLGEARHGTRGGRPDVRLLGGWFVFDSPDTALLVSLLPSLVHVRGVERLSTLVRLVGEEASDRDQDAIGAHPPGGSLADRSVAGDAGRGRASRAAARPGRCAPRVSDAADARAVARSWTVAQLAKTAGLSRSAFFERFTRRGLAADGVPARLADGGREGSAPPPRPPVGEVADASVTARRAPSAPRSAATSAKPPGRYAREGSQRNDVIGSPNT